MDKVKDKSEGKVVSDCLKILAVYGVFAWRNNTGRAEKNGYSIGFGHPGSADIIGLLPDGRFLGVECKTATGQQSKPQKLFERRVTESRGVYLLIRHGLELKRWLDDSGHSLKTAATSDQTDTPDTH